MTTNAVQNIKENAESLQMAVQILLSNPSINRYYRNRLKFFLNYMENSDFDILNSLTIQGKAKFLAARFDRNIAGPRNPSRSLRDS